MPTEANQLDTYDLDKLRLAGEWGLLRDLAGAKVCMTGSMTMKRQHLATLVEAAGGVFTNSVTSDLGLLVVADWTEGTRAKSTKQRDAERRGIRTMTESEFAAELLPTASELLEGRRARFGDPR